MKDERRAKNARTCAGCGKHADAAELVRVVIDPSSGEVAIDFAGSTIGRGAHLHPTRSCVENAASGKGGKGKGGGGLSRAFKMQVNADASELARQIVAGADRRIDGLLAGARRARHLVFGADTVVETLRQDKAALVIVARDAAAAARLGEVTQAIAAGKAIAWSEKAHLGSLLQKDEVAVCAVLHTGVAEAILAAYRTADSFRGADGERGAWSSEVR